MVLTTPTHYTRMSSLLIVTLLAVHSMSHGCNVHFKVAGLPSTHFRLPPLSPHQYITHLIFYLPHAGYCCYVKVTVRLVIKGSPCAATASSGCLTQHIAILALAPWGTHQCTCRKQVVCAKGGSCSHMHIFPYHTNTMLYRYRTVLYCMQQLCNINN